ncbi:unnamed protein product [Adineta steineri]|uniref:Uncharacterized protein n=3 Tax=Adineta steineri TaxID=433720 RepID=A0A819NVX1_9BILA|nr:unnamed protein product [Adineta steineri]CAF1001176.1 unnamed protein product [Adineta steineri]CAF1048969.1 unnamed protein product [Adineta steineri]CAF4002863.1 unnamed protein product [Adineta steineri]CAF4103186.1 unnamed protein product [Adineta steineri]
MTSDLSDDLNSLKLQDNRRRTSANNSSRRNHASGQQKRPSFQSKRAATIDHEGPEEKLRIVVLGATKVGKTCLCQQFLQEKFVTDHKETVDEMYSAEIALVDRHIILEILDTAGIDEFPVMRRLAIARGDAFLIVYAINDASSFDIAQRMRQLVFEIKGDLVTSPIPMLIVGNKCDLDTNIREINRDYAETIVRDQWATNLIETTCRERESVLKAFHLLLHLANINLTLNFDVARRSSDPSLSSDKEQRSTNKRQSCAQQ